MQTNEMEAEKLINGTKADFFEINKIDKPITHGCHAMGHNLATCFCK